MVPLPRHGRPRGAAAHRPTPHHAGDLLLPDRSDRQLHGAATKGGRRGARPRRRGRTRDRTLAAYGRRGDIHVFYGIDPEIRGIAEDPDLFTYLSDSPDISIELGDGRLGVSEARDGTFDLIALDAFTSDAIPIHPLTRVLWRTLNLPQGATLWTDDFSDLASVLSWG